VWYVKFRGGKRGLMVPDLNKKQNQKNILYVGVVGVCGLIVVFVFVVFLLVW